MGARSSFTSSILHAIAVNKEIAYRNSHALATGSKYFKASDDIRTTVSGFSNRNNMALAGGIASNLQDLSLLLSSADRYVNGVIDGLQEIQSLVTQATNTSISSTSRTSYQSQITSILSGINNMASSTEYNGVTLFDGSLAGNNTLVSSSSSVNSIDTVVSNSSGVSNLRTLNQKVSEVLTFSGQPANGDTLRIYAPDGNTSVLFTYRSSGVYDSSVATNICIGSAYKVTALNTLERIRAYIDSSSVLQRLDFSLNSSSSVLTVTSLASGLLYSTNKLIDTTVPTNTARTVGTTYLYQEYNTITTNFATGDTFAIYDPTDSTGVRKVTFTAVAAGSITQGGANFVAGGSAASTAANIVCALQNYTGTNASYLSGLHFALSGVANSIQITTLGYTQAQGAAVAVCPAQTNGGSAIVAKALMNMTNAAGTGVLNTTGSGNTAAAPAGVITSGASVNNTNGITVDHNSFSLNNLPYNSSFTGGINVDFSSLTTTGAAPTLPTDTSIIAATTFGVTELTTLVNAFGACQNNTCATGTAVVGGVTYSVCLFVPADNSGAVTPSTGYVGAHTPLYFKDPNDSTKWFKLNFASGGGYSISSTTNASSLSNIIASQTGALETYTEVSVPVDQSGGAVTSSGVTVADMTDFTARWKGLSDQMTGVKATSVSITEDTSNNIILQVQLSNGSTYRLNYGTVALNADYGTSANQLYPGQELVLVNLSDSNQKLTLSIGGTMWDVSTSAYRDAIASALLYALGGNHAGTVCAGLGDQTIEVSVPDLTTDSLLTIAGTQVTFDVSTSTAATTTQGYVNTIMSNVVSSLQTIGATQKQAEMQLTAMNDQISNMEALDEMLFATDVIESSDALQQSSDQISMAIQSLIRRNSIDSMIKGAMLNSLSSQ